MLPDARSVLGSAMRRGQRATSPLWRRAMAAWATDTTAHQAGRSALVCAPHPDDETLGCGGLIARRRATGASVHVAVAADGGSSHSSQVIDRAELIRMRAAEVEEACRLLGVPASNLTRFDIPDEQLEDRAGPLLRQLVEVLDHTRPDDVFVSSARDWHPDHGVLNRAVRTAVASAARRPRLYEYCVWWWAEGPWLRHPRRSSTRVMRDLIAEPFDGFRGPRPERVATGEFLSTKRAALGAYRSQTQNLTGEPTWAVFEPAFLEAVLGPWELYFPIG